MDPSILTDDDRIKHFDRVFVEMLGGDDHYRMLIDHYGGATYEQLATYYGVSKGTAHSWITAAKAVMRRAGMNVPASPRTRAEQHSG